jgi:hypothetical protein
MASFGKDGPRLRAKARMLKARTQITAVIRDISQAFYHITLNHSSKAPSPLPFVLDGPSHPQLSYLHECQPLQTPSQALCCHVRLLTPTDKEGWGLGDRS